MQQTQTDLPAVPHPLHPLTAAEINSVTSILREEKKLGYNTTRFVSITLKPAAKAFIYAYKKGQPLTGKHLLWCWTVPQEKLMKQ